LPVRRTAGGHRRFLRSEIEMRAVAQESTETQEAIMVVQNAIGRTRLEVAEGRLEQESWYQKLSEEARQRYRHESRYLLQEVMHAAQSILDVESSQAREIGHSYGRLSIETGMTAREACAAFLFFRDMLTESVYSLIQTTGQHASHAWNTLRRRITRFTDQILLALLEHYEQSYNDQV
jgi:hypothetical protein